MSLAHGRHYLAIPGPSVMPDRVLQAMHRPAPNIYYGALAEMTDAMIPDLKRVACTEGHVAIYIANGHGVWEASLANVAAPGEAMLALCTGRFGFGWAETAARMGIAVERMDFGLQAPVDPARLQERLRADTDHAIRVITMVQVDTATSVRSDVAAVRRAIDAAGHPALLMVDCIASLGVDEMRMDDWGADVVITASQKGLMTPPGLGFVFFSDRARSRRAEMANVSMYWDWVPRSEPEMFYQYFNGTAPTHHLYGLREALNMLHEEGMENVWARHAILARTVWAAVEAWGKGGPLAFNIADPALRSHAVTTLAIGKDHGPRLRRWLTEEAGVTLGIGLGMETVEKRDSDGYFRIAHMGHVNAHMVLGVLGTIEAGMTALGIPHGKGALEAAAAVCARV
ncbi:pyridoxal-phosphate-dependent aminotransferase family protein [Mangrovicoccus algicola]|uniref:Alanine--glyoxylate aminotransferase family protein n=1 Tax=Mangrovicoccus algicola TaxID=2771008 RepID=A0A8J7CW27_9RHOB|nr:aminotransferase class V-fold PLP-dependent enzyme [Mangrovicoccus algicola]MBE3639449.1 alanine--glyoxylate aminotransferase family protein [Mangrovicoccus algicola]